MKTIALASIAIASNAIAQPGGAPTSQPTTAEVRRYRDQPLVSEIFTADPSAHVFDGRLYVYCSHDITDGPKLEDVEPFKGSQGNGFKMRDYVILGMDHAGGGVKVHSDVLHIDNVPWVARQMWAPDAAFKNGTYYLYFPAKARDGAFRIGVAKSKSPVGPFTAQPQPIEGSYSIDPAVFTDDDGASYMYFGGLSGGQLQMFVDGVYQPNAPRSDPAVQPENKNKPAVMPRVAKLRDDVLEFAEKPRDVMIVDETGTPLLSSDGSRKFFEASWMHKYNGKYYFSYSTGGTHFIAYATGDSPYGPFTHRGNVLLPVTGWTTHHSIVNHNSRWWLFYADSQISGKTHLRNVKVSELFHEADGSIRTIDPFIED